MRSRVGFIWIYGLIVLFATGVIEMIIMPAITFKLLPSLIMSANQTLSAADTAAYITQTSDVIRFMHMGIYVVMFVILVYLVLSIFTKEEQEFYQP